MDVQCYLCPKRAVHNHHLYTRGSWRASALVVENELALCVDCHAEAHSLGILSWTEKYGLQELVDRAQSGRWSMKEGLAWWRKNHAGR